MPASLPKTVSSMVSLAARSARVIAAGRTLTYVLHEGEPRVQITQNDVRAIQLAKAALYAGVKLLMDRFGTEKVEKIRLAGAFGSHIDVQYAMVLGLIPDCDLAEVSSAGNAAGTGARIALLNKTARAAIEATVHRIEKIETAIEPKFQEHFVHAMAIPTRWMRSQTLRKVVALPAAKETSAEGGEGRRRRRWRENPAAFVDAD